MRSTNFALILSPVLWAAGVTADTSSSTDIVNPKDLRKFKVWAEVDMLTDEVLRALEWKEKTFADVQVWLSFQGVECREPRCARASCFALVRQFPWPSELTRANLEQGNGTGEVT